MRECSSVEARIEVLMMVMVVVRFGSGVRKINQEAAEASKFISFCACIHKGAVFPNIY